MFLCLNFCFYLMLQEEVSDSTYTTYSSLSFTATRYENGINFRCEASNSVMETEYEKPLHNSLFLIVMCKFLFFRFLFDCQWIIDLGRAKLINL